jgi:hypothetical protein
MLHQMNAMAEKEQNLEDDFAVDRGTLFVSSGGGVRKEKLFCKLTDATVLVTAEVLLLKRRFIATHAPAEGRWIKRLI